MTRNVPADTSTTTGTGNPESSSGTATDDANDVNHDPGPDDTTPTKFDDGSPSLCHVSNETATPGNPANPNPLPATPSAPEPADGSNNIIVNPSAPPGEITASKHTRNDPDPTGDGHTTDPATPPTAGVTSNPPGTTDAAPFTTQPDDGTDDTPHADAGAGVACTDTFIT